MKIASGWRWGRRGAQRREAGRGGPGRGRGGTGAGLAGRRARPAGVTGRDRGASGLERDPGGQEGEEQGGHSSRLGLSRTATRARQVRWARGRGSGVRHARAPFAEARGGKATLKRPQSAATRSLPAPTLHRSSCAPRPSENLGAALQPQPKPEPGERGVTQGGTHWTRTPADGQHLPSQARVGTGRRDLRGYSWSAQSAEERAPLRLFPRTPPGGVRPARPLRLLTPAATLLPSPSRAEPQPLAPTASPAAPAPAELRQKLRRTGWVSFGIHGCPRESQASYPR